jgi:hypothetical protein
MRTNHPNYRTLLVIWISGDAVLAWFVHLVNTAVCAVRVGMGSPDGQRVFRFSYRHKIHMGP